MQHKLTRSQAGKVAAWTKHPKATAKRSHQLEALANEMLLAQEQGRALKTEEGQEYPILTARKRKEIDAREIPVGDTLAVRRAAFL